MISSTTQIVIQTQAIHARTTAHLNSQCDTSAESNAWFEVNERRAAPRLQWANGFPVDDREDDRYRRTTRATIATQAASHSGGLALVPATGLGACRRHRVPAVTPWTSTADPVAETGRDVIPTMPRTEVGIR